MHRGGTVSKSGKSKILLNTLRKLLEFIFSTVGHCKEVSLLEWAAHWQGHKNKNSHARNWYSVWIYQLGSFIRELYMKSWSRWPWNLRIIPSLYTKSIQEGQCQLRNRRHMKQKSKETKQWLYKDNWFCFFNNVWLVRTFSLAVLQTGSENKPRFSWMTSLPSVTGAGCFCSQLISKTAASVWSKSDRAPTHKLFGKQNSSHLIGG